MVELVEVRLTAPENEGPPVSVILVVPVELFGTWILDGLAETLNCRTLTLTVVE